MLGIILFVAGAALLMLWIRHGGMGCCGGHRTHSRRVETPHHTHTNEEDVS